MFAWPPQLQRGIRGDGDSGVHGRNSSSLDRKGNGVPIEDLFEKVTLPLPSKVVEDEVVLSVISAEPWKYTLDDGRSVVGLEGVGCTGLACSGGPDVQEALNVSICRAASQRVKETVERWLITKNIGERWNTGIHRDT